MHDLKTTQALNQGITGKKMDHKQVAEELYKLVDTFGSDYVYEDVTFEDEFGEIRDAGTCMYSTEDKKPSCIVGHIIHKHFPEVFEKIYQGEWGSTHFPTSQAVDFIAVKYPNMFTEQAKQLLHKAQLFQDAGATWGKSVDAAVTTYANEFRRM